MTNVSADARITTGCAGIWNDEQEAARKRIVDFTHTSSKAKLCLQIGHAGPKDSTKKPWESEISATDWLAQGGITPADAVAIARAFKAAGVDIVDVSAGQTSLEAQPV
jgi:2,4-dienoyl-CoA reductase-like NADH-dependent reductase (Old Yellow Enzyme family)